MPGATETEGLRRRRGAAAGGDTASTTTAVTEASGASGDRSKPSDDTTRPPTTEEQIASSKASFNIYVLVCLAVSFFFTTKAVNTHVDDPGIIRSIMIDAGSTGTRAQIFTFAIDPHLRLLDTQMHEEPVTLATLGMLSPTEGKAVDTFFAPILAKVKKSIPAPARKHKSIPISLRATAGLRLMGHAPAERALALSRMALGKSGFMFNPEWVSVMDERDEAVHGWITTNYLLGHLNATEVGDDKDDKKRLVGTLDLGGGSLQTVFRSSATPREPEPISETQLKAGLPQPTAPEIVEAPFMGKSYRVLAKSDLGLGLHSFKKRLYQKLDLEQVLETNNPCFSKGHTLTAKELTLGAPGAEKVRVVNIVGDGDFDECVAKCESILDAYDVPSSSMVEALHETEFVAFAYFYDRTVRLGMSPTATPAELAAKGAELCNPMDMGANAETGPTAGDEACAEFSYIYALLKRLSGDFSEEKNVTFRFEQYVDGHMLGWALGTILDQMPSVIEKQLG